MRDCDYSTASEFLARFFAHTTGAVEIRALPNERMAGRAAPLFTREPAMVEAHCTRWDQLDRAVFFGVCTRLTGAPSGSRADLAELPALWVDIDTGKLGLAKAAVVAALRAMPMPPSRIVDSGGGIHAYWLLKEPIDVRAGVISPDDEEAIIAVLRQLAGVTAGDPAVCDLARVMRLPGTHNTKTGELRLVEVLEATDARYEFSDIQDMLDTQRPVVVRPQQSKANLARTALERDPFLAAAERFGFKAPIDVERRLAEMTYLGIGDAGVHQTQLSVSASLASQGVPDEQIVKLLLEATQHAVGLAGEHWNWKREEKAIRNMVETGRAKYAPVAKPPPPPPMTVVQLRGGGAQEQPETEADPPESDNQGSARPTIRILTGKLHDTATIAESVLKATGAPLYTRSGMIVKPVMDDVEAARGLRTTIARLSKVSVVGMVDWLSRTADWIKYDGRAKKWVAADPPENLAATILSRDGEWTLPPIVGVITTPTMRPDGSILDAEGYDPATRLLLLDPPAMPLMPARPSKDDALAALDLLNSLLEDFSFVDDASRSVALSALITPVVRGALSVAPLHAMRAPTAGSGKSYLVDIASAIATGQRCPVIAAGKTEEEQEKRLGAALMAGQAIVSIDNLNGELTGDALCQMVERPVVRIRPLGRSDLIQVESKATVYATGNNIIIVGDMVRRAVVCSLDVELERPELRQFEHDPLDMVFNSRGKFVAACLTIVRAYKVAGCPSPCPTLASFEDWSLLVRSALVWLSQSDPVDTIEASRAEDPEISEIQNVFIGWKQSVGANEQKSVTEVIAVAEEKDYTTSDDAYQKTTENGYRHPEFRDALLAVAGDPKGISARRLGWWLSRYKGRIVVGMRVVGRIDGHTKTNKWKLVDLSSTPADPLSTHGTVNDE